MDFNNIFANKEDSIKNDIKKSKVQSIIWAIFSIGLFLFSIGNIDWVSQNLSFIYDLGLGLFSSAIISLIFMKIQMVSDNIRSNKKKIAFYETFYIYCYNMVRDLPDIVRKDAIITCKDYIIEVHREFHEPYKKFIAKNLDQKEKNKCFKKITNFVNSYEENINFMFEIYKSNIDCFDGKEVKLLNDFFLEFKQISNNKKDEYKLLAMAKFLTTFRRMIKEIKNLQTLDLLKFEFKSKKLIIHTEEFFQVETFLKDVEKFQNTRQANIMKHYSKKTTN